MQDISNPPTSRATGKPFNLSPKSLIEHAGSHDSPPAALRPEIAAIWWDVHGDTTHALQIVEEEPGLNAVWVRAYLRRKMGDDAIASYWYAKAIRPKATGSSVAERDMLLKVLIGGTE